MMSSNVNAKTLSSFYRKNKERHCLLCLDKSKAFLVFYIFLNEKKYIAEVDKPLRLANAIAKENKLQWSVTIMNKSPIEF